MKLVVNFNEKTGEMNVNIEENKELNNAQKVASYTAIMKKLIRITAEDIVADMDETKEKKEKLLKRTSVAIYVEAKAALIQRNIRDEEKEKMETNYMISQIIGSLM
jgi:hypothetical protein